MAITTILLDLDNTLLVNDMGTFLPPYFAALEKSLEKFLGGKDLQHVARRAVQAVLISKDRNSTNLETFLNEFSRGLDCTPETLQPVFDAFYQQEYPRLQSYTRPLPEARQVVSRLLAGGYQLVIATNPLFPAVAITQRLEWAGLAGFPFALVTAMDNSYSCKPDPRYYQEILARTASRPEDTWMVGDDPQNDILPARAVGIKTWWITPSPSGRPVPLAPQTDRQGSLSDFLNWIEAEQNGRKSG